MSLYVCGEPAIAPNAQGQVVVGVLSDTHGVLSPEAFRTLADMDPQLIVHAGDICGDDILPRLEMLAPVAAVLGNNDWPGAYGPGVTSRSVFEVAGVDFAVTHIPSQLGMLTTRVAVCGHTHVPQVRQVGTCTVVNPGSTTRPRGGSVPSVARIVLEPGCVRQIQIVPVAQP